MNKEQKQLEYLIRLAVTCHEGQEDKGGSPYILHCLSVMHEVQGTDYELKAIAVGHDLAEDAWVDEKFLKSRNISSRIIKGIMDLTKRKGESSRDYLKKVLLNPDASRVKLQDILHNLDTSRLSCLTKEDKLRLAKYNLYREILLVMVDWYSDNPDFEEKDKVAKVEEVMRLCGL